MADLYVFPPDDQPPAAPEVGEEGWVLGSLTSSPPWMVNKVRQEGRDPDAMVYWAWFDSGLCCGLRLPQDGVHVLDPPTGPQPWEHSAPESGQGRATHY